jgi:cytochrome c-type biogenesis protein
MSTQPARAGQTGERRDVSSRRLLILGGMAIGAAVLIGILSLNGGKDAEVVTGRSNVLVLAVPAFLAGVLSFLSPCTLPILPAYFAFTFQARKQTIVLTSVAFFLGLATTMTLLGASATALSGLIFDNKQAITFWGGLVVIGFGVMAMLGKGFAGPQLQERPVATVAGSYLYGATFALGWTACVGPILGALLTLLLATEGVAIVQGAVLSFIYALGLGMPLIVLATFFSRLGTGSRFWQVIKGRGFDVQLGPWALHLHSTSMISGLLMVLMGFLLATGRLEAISQVVSDSSFSQWWIDLESGVSKLFGLH